MIGRLNARNLINDLFGPEVIAGPSDIKDEKLDSQTGDLKCL
jgi:hypothetical protein